MDGVERAWRELHDSAPASTVFTAFDWVRPWLDNYGKRARATPLVLAAYEGRDLAGIAPLVRWSGTYGGVPVRRIDFAGHNFGLGDFVIAEGARRVASAFASHLLSASKSWDVVLLKGLPRTAPPTLELLNAAGDFTLETLPVAAIEMEGRSWERYLEQKGRNLRQQIQRAEKRSKDVRVTSERGLDPDQVDVAMDRVVRIGLRSWKGSTDEAIASNAHVERFYRQVAKRMNQLRRLEIETLFAGSRPVAYVFGLAHGRDYFHIDTAYDESFKESSPGTLLNLALIKRLFREGYRRYVNEGEDAYKDRWTTDTLDLCTVRILGPSLRSRLSRFIREEAAPAARWLKGRLLR